MTVPLHKVMNIEEAAAYLRISTDTLYKYAAQGIVPAFKMGNRWRFTRTALDRWLDDLVATGREIGPPMKAAKEPKAS